MVPSASSLFKKLLKALLRLLVAATLAIVLMLLFLQHKLIYHPRPYDVPPAALNPALVPLPYSTSQGRQQAFYLPPRTLPLRHLWVLFPGNASRALDWLGFLEPPPNPRDGFLLIDYPGYGECQGYASPDNIQESAEAAFVSLAQSLHEEPARLEEKTSILGLSIGCATGLNFAVRHPVDRVILVAPFTSLRDMARRVVGWPLCWLLMHDFENRARLRELAARPHSPRVTIFHGDDDMTVPISMGRELASLLPGMIDFHVVPGAGHKTVLSLARPEISPIMRQ